MLDGGGGETSSNACKRRSTDHAIQLPSLNLLLDLCVRTCRGPSAYKRTLPPTTPPCGYRRTNFVQRISDCMLLICAVTPCTPIGRRRHPPPVIFFFI